MSDDEYQGIPIPDTPDVARQRVDDQMQRMQNAAAGSAVGVLREPAILNALIARETAATMLVATDAIATRLQGLTNSIDRSAAATDASARQLAKWTKVMAWATMAIAVFAVAQVIVAVLAWLKPR